MSDLVTLLRDLAREVDVRRPIMIPPRLPPALLAAADALEREERRAHGMRYEIARMRPVVEAAEALRERLRLMPRSETEE